MGEDPNVGITERVKGYFRTKAILPSDKVDQFITGHLPEYVEEYKLARRSDLQGVDKKVEGFLEEVNDMQAWKKDTEKRLDDTRYKIKRLERMYGSKED
ncbi:MAG: hypothetical protein R6U17_02800 [Thermoplasmata archaeon]